MYVKELKIELRGANTRIGMLERLVDELASKNTELERLKTSLEEWQKTASGVLKALYIELDTSWLLQFSMTEKLKHSLRQLMNIK